MHGSSISWMSKLQPIVALRTTEAEYIAFAEAEKEAVWLRRFLSKLEETQQAPTEIRGDNQGSLALTNTTKYHARSKHIDIKYHKNRDLVEHGEITVRYVSTQDQLADVFTKPLPRPRFQELRS